MSVYKYVNSQNMSNSSRAKTEFAESVFQPLTETKAVNLQGVVLPEQLRNCLGVLLFVYKFTCDKNLNLTSNHLGLQAKSTLSVVLNYLFFILHGMTQQFCSLLYFIISSSLERHSPPGPKSQV